MDRIMIRSPYTPYSIYLRGTISRGESHALCNKATREDFTVTSAETNAGQVRFFWKKMPSSQKERVRQERFAFEGLSTV